MARHAETEAQDLERMNYEALITASGQKITRLLTFGSRGPRLPKVAVLQPPERPLFYLDRRRLGFIGGHVNVTVAYFNTLPEMAPLRVRVLPRRRIRPPAYSPARSAARNRLGRLAWKTSLHIFGYDRLVT
jgi:hypothetical protein